MEIVQGRSSALHPSPHAASGGYGTQRSAQKIQLDTMNGPGGRDNGYSAFVSKGISTPVAGTKADGVLRTTEVHVHHASPTTAEEEELPYRPPYHSAANAGLGEDIASQPHGRPESPASSAEVQFAGKGA